MGNSTIDKQFLYVCEIGDTKKVLDLIERGADVNTPDEYDNGGIYIPAFAGTIWQQNKHDKLLRDIAVENVRAFFVSIDKNLLIAPYDGGVDFILKDTMTRDIYKLKYKDWLSEREDGC